MNPIYALICLPLIGVALIELESIIRDNWSLRRRMNHNVMIAMRR